MVDEFDRSPIRIPPEVFLLPIGAAALRVLCALFRFMDKSMKAHPGRQKILLYLYDQDVRNMRRAMRELVSKGFLEIHRKQNETTGADEVCYYTLHLPSLKKIREERKTKKCALGGVTGTPRRVSKQAVSQSANRYELEPKNLKINLGSTRPRVGSVDKSKESSDAYRLLGHYGELFKKKTGKVFSPSKLEWHAARSWVSPGGYGLASALAVCDLWFSGHAPWADKAKACGYAFLGNAKLNEKKLPGMEWHREWITDFPTYDERKRKYAGEF